MRALEEKGLRLLTQRQRRFGVADSHHFAHEFFASSSRAADLVLNIDAHHDLFAAEDEMTCGNWATYFVAQHPNVRYQQIYPSWKGPEEDDVPSVSAEFHQWGSWRGFTSAEDVRIRHIFLCRSAGWVAPHHDGRFLKVVEALGEIAEPEYLEGVEVRQAPWLFGRATRERAESRRVARIGR